MFVFMFDIFFFMFFLSTIFYGDFVEKNDDEPLVHASKSKQYWNFQMVTDFIIVFVLVFKLYKSGNFTYDYLSGKYKKDEKSLFDVMSDQRNKSNILIQRREKLLDVYESSFIVQRFCCAQSLSIFWMFYDLNLVISFKYATEFIYSIILLFLLGKMEKYIDELNYQVKSLLLVLNPKEIDGERKMNYSAIEDVR